MSIPRATARLQLHKDFTLDDAAEVVDYYASLGISHLYLSPLLTARSGSTHGYDIVDPTRINPELGGEPALHRLVARLREAGMGLIVDIVPNHMGVGGADNPWWLDVLEWGRYSNYARWFDIDWNSPDPTLNGKIMLPFLGDQYAQILRSPDLKLTFDESVGSLYFSYFSHRFPVAPGSYSWILRLGGAALDSVAKDYPDVRPEEPVAYALHIQRLRLLHDLYQTPQGRQAIDLALASFSPESAGGVARVHRLLERQNYKLTWWRNAAEEINWRRFFEVSDLAGVRVELDDVFEATHALLFRLFSEGLVDGVRVDHVDGLADPSAYCRKLRARLEQLSASRPPNSPDSHPYIIVEKILARGETLRSDWTVDGTTGYDFMDQVGALLHDPAGLSSLNQLWVELATDNDNFATHVLNARRQLLRENFVGEFAALTRSVHAVARTELDTRDIPQAAISRVLTELLVGFPVYRTYASESGHSEADQLVIGQAVHHARQNLAPHDVPLLDTLITLFDTNSIDPDASADALPLRQLAVRRFEQLTPPLTAKAVEDTAFYRYGRLLSRNEVGADPDCFASTVAEFHALNQARAETFPHTMLATATHDHKRGEDVRARLAVLSEFASEWASSVHRWIRLHTELRSTLQQDPNSPAVLAPLMEDELMLYQMILGAWPFELKLENQEQKNQYVERLARWQEKALREAKRQSSWALPNIEYEQACNAFLQALFDDTKCSIFLSEITEWVSRVSPYGIANSLTQTLLRLTSPGVPDLYQGAEFWDLSLVDPDNRLPVDYERRACKLMQGTSAAGTDWSDRQLKQSMIQTVLGLRSSNPELFSEGTYLPLEVQGPLAEHVIAYMRIYKQEAIIVAALRLSRLVLEDDLRLSSELKDAEPTLITFPAAFYRTYRNLFDQRDVEVSHSGLEISDIFSKYPVALLTEFSSNIKGIL
jgi:(1->4)-alpha-D-glucan 1-alpha-D-glucosylmutase